MPTNDEIITQLREQVNALLAQIKQLDEPERTMLLREARARFDQVLMEVMFCGKKGVWQ